jgi:hypothetical protein
LQIRFIGAVHDLAITIMIEVLLDGRAKDGTMSDVLSRHVGISEHLNSEIVAEGFLRHVTPVVLATVIAEIITRTLGESISHQLP